MAPWLRGSVDPWPVAVVDTMILKVNPAVAAVATNAVASVVAMVMAVVNAVMVNVEVVVAMTCGRCQHDGLKG